MLASFSVVPIGSGTELKEQVAEIIRAIDASGLPYRVHAMCTEVEGEWDRVMAVVKRAHDIGRRFSGRVLTTIVVDDREGFDGRIEGKVKDVEGILGKKASRP